MDLDKYREAWKADTLQTQVLIDFDSLTHEVQRSQHKFGSIIFWRDVREAGTSLIMIPVWLAIGVFGSMHWTWYLMIPSLIFVAAFILLDRLRHPQRPSDPGQPLVFYAKESLQQVEHQIWLLRNVFWWYLLPICIAIVAFFLHSAWKSTGHWLGFLVVAAGLNAFLYFIYRGVYRLNQTAVHEQLEPRRSDLSRLVDSLEGDGSDQDSGDIMELVAALNDPATHLELNFDWAENWNEMVPTWGVVGRIMLPALAGALCGFCSGWFLAIPEMGPTLFQTVIGAVLPFEFVFFRRIWKHFKKKKELLAEPQQEEKAKADDDDVEKTKPNTADEDHDKPKWPRAPAMFIVVFIFFISLMALVALVSFFTAKRDSTSEVFLSEPEFGDVSAMTNDHIAKIDSWLQSQVDAANYPSLTTAIVRDGKMVYGRSFGFANVKRNEKASLQTPYYVASVTKAFTATLAVLLDEKGVIKLDDPVAQYLPKGVKISRTPESGATITMRQLASHTSGLPRGVPGKVQSVEGWYQLEPQRLYDLLSNVQLESTPGTQEEYSNLAFGLLGHAMELAADKPLAELMDEMICQPMGLKQTSLQVNDRLKPATGYGEGGWHFEKTHSFRSRLAGSGGLVATAEDLAKFLMAQMDTGILSHQALQTLHKRTILKSRKVTGTALGWSLGYSRYVGPIIKKNGGRSNCSVWIGFVPEYKTGVVVVTNCGGPDVDRIGRWMLERSVPGAYQPVTKHGYACVTPYSGVHWENERPIVRLEDQWLPLISIDGVSAESITEFCRKEYGEKAKKRIAEDIVQVLADMGHEPDWHVTLELDRSGNRMTTRVLMTEKNRRRSRNFFQSN